jgi:arginine deiminase
MRLNVTNETGKLESVLVHLPGREIDLMVPDMMAQLLFDDILYGQVAREEHRRFQQIIRFVADEVYDLQDLLEEVFEDRDVKEQLVGDFCRRAELPRRLAEWLSDQGPADLAEIMVGGVVSEKPRSGELPRFDLAPVPNLYFTRDPQVIIGDGVVVSRMATEARERESLLSEYVFRHHRAFRNRDVFWMPRIDRSWPKSAAAARRRPTIEGGDVLVASRELLIVGLSERTNRAGVENLARSLKKSGSRVETIIVVELPKLRSFMHLDTVFTFASPGECLIYPPVILAGGGQAAKVWRIDLRKRQLAFVAQKSLLATLKKYGFDLEPICCGGKRAIDQQREQWTDGANAFALAPGIVLLYERNVQTAHELDAHGYHIVYEDDLLLGRTELETWNSKKYAIQIQGHELSRARGGPRCMAMPLAREEV